MKAKNKIITAVLLSAGAAVGTALINKYIKMSAVARNLLTQPEPRCYRWSSSISAGVVCIKGRIMREVNNLLRYDGTAHGQEELSDE